MIRGYVFYVFAIITTSWMQPSYSHALPKGFHLSSTCQPRCNTRESCVIYRTSAGPPNPTCLLLDPHQMVLDGTVIIPIKNQMESSRSPTVTKTETGKPQQTLEEKNRVRQLHNNVINTVKAVKSLVGRRQLELIPRMKSISQTLRHELLTKLGSLGKRPDVLNSKHFTSKGQTINPSQGVASISNKASDSKTNKFTGLYLIRDSNGGVSFRRSGQTFGEKIEVQEVPLSNKIEGSVFTNSWQGNDWSTNNERQTVQTTPTVIQTFNPQQKERKIITGNSSACQSCDPDQSCPTGFYCYFSPECAKQVCQQLK